jgi:BirA family transcriptional regulator, biotin operon repressor / biotin---[acetyl-CoA-carboxylase] ligase
MMAPFDLARIVNETLVREVEFHDSLPSTNTRALERAKDNDVPLPLLVLTERQTAGRGRGTNTWWSASGSLTFSLVLGPELSAIQTESWPSIALAAAVGVCEALEALAPGATFGIRWPNDICFGKRKICGVLPELQTQPRPRLVLGVGINLNNATQTAPGPLRATATSLIDLTGQSLDPTEALLRVLTALEKRLQQLSAHDPALPRDWDERCLLRERTVRINLDPDHVEGVCKGIDRTGALCLQTNQGIQRIYAGTINAIDGEPLLRP